MKTEQSEAPATMSPTLAEVLKCWHQQTPYAQPSDWILASFKLKGRQPRTASILVADHLRPVAISAGIVLKPGQRFGFHNLRHSLATFLINQGAGHKDGSRSAPPRECFHHTRAIRAKREFVDSGSAGIDAEGDFTERFRRGRLNFTGDVLQV
jgi:integrase